MLPSNFHSFKLNQKIVVYLVLCVLSSFASTISSNGQALQAGAEFNLGVAGSHLAASINKRDAHRRRTVETGLALLHKRNYALMTLEGGWEVIYKYFNTFQMLPVDAVTAILSKFYGDIMLKVLDIADGKPVSHIVLDHGSLRLEFWESSGEAIPWHVVYKFANNLLTMTSMGFTSTYDAIYHHKPSGSNMMVKLSVIAPMAVALVGHAVLGAKK